jgi:hypothetical protein
VTFLPEAEAAVAIGQSALARRRAVRFLVRAAFLAAALRALLDRRCEAVRA